MGRPVPPLRTVRQAHGIRLRVLARETGLDPGYLSRCERGEQRLSIDALYKIAVALGLTQLAEFLRPYSIEASSGE